MNIMAIEKGVFALMVTDTNDVYVRMTTSEGFISWYLLEHSDLELMTCEMMLAELEEDYINAK
jgi:predicted nucleic acid-binding protein